MKKVLIVALVAASIFTMGCSGGNNTKETTKEEKTSQPSNVSNTIELTANDQLKYSTNELHVKANEPVKLTLKNIGTMPKESMGHNFTLLKDGTDIPGLAAQAVSAPDHMPNNPAIIAHTKLLGPGESDTIDFTVPAGSYIYICTFPGHYMTMTGVLTAE